MFPCIAGRCAIVRAMACLAVLILPALSYGQLFDELIPLNAADTDGFMDEDVFPAIATNKTGRWIALWASTASADGSGGDSDIVMTQSDDNGATWTAPAAFNSNAFTDAGADDERPFIATDGAGNWIAAWHSTFAGTNLGSDPDIFYSVSTDDGDTWSALAPLSNAASTDSGREDQFPRLATDGDGHWVAVWQAGGSLGLDKKVRFVYSENNGMSWSNEAELTANPLIVSSQVPDIAYSDGVWMVVYPSFDPLDGTVGGDSDLFVTTSSDGMTWSDVVVANDYAAVEALNDRAPSLAAGADGAWTIVWQTANDIGGLGADIDILMTRSEDDGNTWSSPAALNTNAGSDSGEDTSPVLVSDGRGFMFCSWTSRENIEGAGMDQDIVFASSRDDGLTWTAPTLVNSSATDDGDQDMDDHVRLAADGAGYWLAVWDGMASFSHPHGNDPDVYGAAALFPDPFDVNLDNLVNAVDIQTVINAALGLDVGGLDTDLDDDGGTNAVDVQLIINEVLSR